METEETHKQTNKANKQTNADKGTVSEPKGPLLPLPLKISQTRCLFFDTTPHTSVFPPCCLRCLYSIVISKTTRETSQDCSPNLTFSSSSTGVEESVVGLFAFPNCCSQKSVCLRQNVSPLQLQGVSCFPQDVSSRRSKARGKAECVSVSPTLSPIMSNLINCFNFSVKPSSLC